MKSPGSKRDTATLKGMKKMKLIKKIAATVLALGILVGALSGCGSAETYEMRVGGMKGPTTIGMVKMLSDSEDGSSGLDIDFTLTGAADELAPKVIKGEVDMAAVPANLASVLWNKTQGQVVLLAVNTLGVLYIVDTDGSVQSVEDLKGKTVYASGKGSTPEYNLRYILSANGIDPDKDVTIEWKSEASEAVAMLATGGGIAMLPQPYVASAQAKVEGLRIALDLTEEWEKLGVESKMITGVLVGRREFVENDPEAVEAFLEEYSRSIEYSVENVSEAAELVGEYGIVGAEIAEKAIPYCNLSYIDGEEMKTAVSGYLQILYDADPASVGGNLPDDGFYYGK